MRILYLALLLGSFARAEETPADPRRLKPDHAPTPYTAEQIREGCPAGRISTFKHERAGQPSSQQTMRFLEVDADGALLEVAVSSGDGKALGKPKSARSTWRQLQSYASFPATATRIENGKVETPAGTFDCMIYIVKGKNNESRFYFAKYLAGPPVKLTQHLEGKLVFAMTLVRHRDGDEAKLLEAMGGDAKAAFNKMGREDVTLKGFVARSGIADKKFATRAFHRLDRNADGKILLEEFLKVWMDWAG